MKFLKIKPFQETLDKGWCGPAVLKMILEFYGIRKSEKELARLAGTTFKAGTNANQMQSVLRCFGLKTKIKDNSTFDDIKRNLRKNIPVIVDWFTHGRRDYPDSMVAEGHYSIVVGLDKSYIYLQDPEIGKLRKIKREDFLKVWFDYSGAILRSKKQFYVRRIIAVYK